MKKITLLFESTTNNNNFDSSHCLTECKTNSMRRKFASLLHLSLLLTIWKNGASGVNVIEGSRSSNPIALDAETFTDLLRNGKIFVDKSLLIKHVLDTLDIPFKLITRPIGWGKSVNMDMIKLFLELELEEDSEVVVPREQTLGYRIFQKGEIADDDGHVMKLRWPLLITNDEEAMEDHQGKYPVIYIPLGNLKPKSYMEFEREVARRMREAFGKFNYRRLCSALHAMRRPVDKWLLRKLYEAMDEKSGLLWGNLRYMCELLEMYFEVKPFILIDDYDEPILQVMHLRVANMSEIVTQLMDSYDALFSELRHGGFHSSAIVAGTTMLIFERFKRSVVPSVNKGYVDEGFTMRNRSFVEQSKDSDSQLDDFDYDSDKSEDGDLSSSDDSSVKKGGDDSFIRTTKNFKGKGKGKNIRTPKSFTMKNKRKVMTTNTPKYTLINNKEDEARFLRSYSAWYVGTTADIYAKTEKEKRSDRIHQYYGLSNEEVRLLFHHVDLPPTSRDEAIACYGGYEFHDGSNQTAPSLIAKFVASGELKNYWPLNTVADTLAISCLRQRYFHRLIHRCLDGFERIRPPEIGNPFNVYENDVVEFARYLENASAAEEMSKSDIAICIAAGYFTERIRERSAFRGIAVYRVKIPNEHMKETLRNRMMEFNGAECGLVNGIGPIMEKLHNVTENLRDVLLTPEGDTGNISRLATSMANFLPSLPCFGGDSLVITNYTMYYVYHAMCLIAFDLEGFKFVEAELLDYYGKDPRAFILMKRKQQGYCIELTLGHESAKFAVNETAKRANHPMNQEYQIKTIKRVGINYSKNRTVHVLTAFSSKVELYFL